MAPDAEDGKIVGLRSSARKNDLAIGAIEHRGNLPAGVIQLRAGRLPIMMDTGRVAENLGHRREHGFQHFPGHGRCRVVIEIISLHGFL